MTEMIQKEEKNDERWQPRDHNVNLPFNEFKEKDSKKNVILIVIYLTLLIGSLFAI